MPSRPRITLAGVPLHIIQRGNNRQACCLADGDYKTFPHWLVKYAREHACVPDAYVLMTNHAESADVVAGLQKHHPLLFDLVLKRSLLWNGNRFPANVFETASSLA